MDKFSPEVFKTSFAGETVAVFCGAAGNKFLFSNENKLVASWMPSSFLKIINAKNSETNGILQKTMLRSILPQFLKPEALQKYVPIMDRMAMQHLERDWSGTFRKVIKDFTYAGFKIPKEWKCSSMHVWIDPCCHNHNHRPFGAFIQHTKTQITFLIRRSLTRQGLKEMNQCHTVLYHLEEDPGCAPAKSMPV
ncbi:hypothetical protein RJ640_009201 [Escallonia rubra]|uniref:Uncharacterized protein n=1 Tax=Escallonia rubra TaxID=112253 RepID=A0AA88QWV9_9ASTE|nr:hypothetical protein RJ640_009201 [Escallonia rubra]